MEIGQRRQRPSLPPQVDIRCIRAELSRLETGLGSPPPLATEWTLTAASRPTTSKLAFVRVYRQKLGRSRTKSEGKKTLRMNVPVPSAESPSRSKVHPDSDDSDSVVRDYVTRLSHLSSSLHRTQQRLAQVTKERNRLLHLNRTEDGQVQDRDAAEIFSELWREILSDKGTDMRFAKRELGKKLQGKDRDAVEMVLESYSLGLTRRELGRVLERFTVKRAVDTRAFLAELSKHQPYALYEDIEGRLGELQTHFAVRNVSKSELVAAIASSSPRDISRKKPPRVLTEPPLCLPHDLASLLHDYLWKGRTESVERRIESIGVWETLDRIVAKVRLGLASRDKTLEDVKKVLPIPLCASEFPSLLVEKFALTASQATVLSAFLFPPSESPQLPPHCFLSVLEPQWKTWSELDFRGYFRELATTVVPAQLREIAMRTSPVSPYHISLSDFLSNCEKAVNAVIPMDSKYAFALFCYRDTQEVDWMRFDLFARELHVSAAAEPR